ncbi:MAG: hypothetical protein K2O14_13165 [Oscillospiraceae bacterium]|nr:hypothetical protein [Oscillospiraceae bacterium]
MVIYLAFFGLIFLIVAAAVVLGTPAVEEGTPADKPDPANKSPNALQKRR